MILFARSAVKALWFMVLAALLLGAPACTGSDEEQGSEQKAVESPMPQAGQQPGKSDEQEIAFVKSCNWLGNMEGHLLLLHKLIVKDPGTFGEVFSSYPGFKATAWQVLHNENRRAVVVTGLVNTPPEVAEAIRGLMNQGKGFLKEAGNLPPEAEQITQERINYILESLLKRKCHYSVMMAFALNPEQNVAQLNLFGGVLTDQNKRFVMVERKERDPDLTLGNLHQSLAKSTLRKVLAEAVLYAKHPKEM